MLYFGLPQQQQKIQKIYKWYFPPYLKSRMHVWNISSKSYLYKRIPIWQSVISLSTPWLFVILSYVITISIIIKNKNKKNIHTRDTKTDLQLSENYLLAWKRQIDIFFFLRIDKLISYILNVLNVNHCLVNILNQLFFW